MDQRNLILAVGFSILILLGWSALFPPQGGESTAGQNAAIQTAEKTTASNQSSAGSADVPPVSPASHEAEGVAPVQASRVAEISNDLLDLSINEKGWLTQVSLKKYRDSLEPGAANVRVLKSDDKQAVYVNAGVVGRRLQAPFHVVKMAANHVILQATLDDGHIWERAITLNQGSYLIEMKDRVLGGAGMKLYQQVVERNPNKKASTFYEHMGPTALLNDKLIEPDYDDLDEKGAERMASVGGWTAIMSRYFIAALIANPERDYPYYFKGDGRSYQAGLIDDGMIEGKDAHFSMTLFVGPKSLPILEQAGSKLERSVDFGWFAPISKPMHTFLGWLYKYTGNYGWCIVILVLCIKILFFYPTQKSYQSMASMRKLQPEMVRLKDLYGDDRQKMGQEVMKLYQKHKVNPLGGCLPIIIQIPVFFALYKVLLMSIEMRQAPFIGWIQDMSVQDPYFVLPLLMGASMYIQQKLNPQPTDPMQAKVMQFLPPLFTVMFLFFPAGLVLYWVVNNTLSIIQQRLVMKSMNVD